MIQLARIAYTDKELQLLARLMRAEAEGEGQMGMLLVGNVCVNRAVANCLDFKKITTVEKAVMQKPGGFEATSKGYFYQAARSQDRKLAKRILEGEKFHPATHALWFYNPHGQECRKTWWNQQQSGAYKKHCFYAPSPNENCY